jgi:hypothetical protein
MIRRNWLNVLLVHLFGGDTEFARLAADCTGQCIKRQAYAAALLYSTNILPWVHH